MNRRGIGRLAVSLALLMLAGCGDVPPAEPSADLVLLDGYVYTADPERTVAEALAIREGRIVAVGTSEFVRTLVGDATRVVDLAGRFVLPGLHDVHIHPLYIVAPDACDFDSAPMTLEQTLIVLVDDSPCQRRRQEHLQPSRPLQLTNLLANSPLQRRVQLCHLSGLRLDHVVELLDSEQGTHTCQQLGGAEGLLEEIIRARFDSLDPFLIRI